MKKIFQISILSILALFFSCRTTYRIEKTEFDLIPYSGEEILVYESNQNEIDTIILKKYKGWSKTEKTPYRIYHNRYEKYGIKLTSSKVNFLIELNAFDWKGIRIDLRQKSESNNYINNTRFTKSEFENIPNITLEISNKEYNDVKIILGENSGLKNRNSIIKFYWSKKNGLLGWDSYKTKWRLKKKYVPQQRV
jgi:hypothetical protein